MGVEPLDPGTDPGLLRQAGRMTPEERLREAASWNRFAGELEIAASQQGKRR